jgi:hypothetical protein
MHLSAISVNCCERLGFEVDAKLFGDVGTVGAGRMLSPWLEPAGPRILALQAP